MRIICTVCAAEYEVPAASLRPQRKAHCTCCNAEWVPQESDEPAEAEGLDDPHAHGAAGVSDTASPHGPGSHETVAPPRAPLTLRAAWAASLLLLVGSSVATVVWRGPVARAWPASSRILGTPSLPRPLQPTPGTAPHAAGPTHDPVVRR